MKITVRVQPRSSRNEVIRAPDGSIKVYLTAPPVDNQANRALRDALAEYFHVGISRIRIVRGRTAREKAVDISYSATQNK